MKKTGKMDHTLFTHNRYGVQLGTKGASLGWHDRGWAISTEALDPNSKDEERGVGPIHPSGEESSPVLQQWWRP